MLRAPEGLARHATPEEAANTEFLGLTPRQLQRLVDNASRWADGRKLALPHGWDKPEMGGNNRRGGSICKSYLADASPQLHTEAQLRGMTAWHSPGQGMLMDLGIDAAAAAGIATSAVLPAKVCEALTEAGVSQCPALRGR